MEAEGWRFLPENRRWDADDREAIARATGLAALTPTAWLAESDAWFKAFARAYARSRGLNLALRECAGGEDKKAPAQPQHEWLIP